MKLKYGKIRGIPVEVCTAEQKIAYNLAFRAHINYGDEYSKLDSGVAKAEAIGSLIRRLLNDYCSAYSYEPGKYNLDAIQAALNAGLKKYMDGRRKILGSYEEIGDAFPANYL